MTFLSKSVAKLHGFKNGSDQLTIINRTSPSGSKSFFKKLTKSSFISVGRVRKRFVRQDIKKILETKIPKEIQDEQFYKFWLNDMINMSDLFCNFLNDDSICFWLGSERSCKRYHVDSVPYRMLVTYAGQGTELLNDKGADRIAFVNGMPNEKIVKDKSYIEFINQWDISIFRGGKNGILHRSPDSALNGRSILMKLDYGLFWEKIKDYPF